MSQVEPVDAERARALSEVRDLRLYLRTVGDTLRLLILRELSLNQEMSVTELAQALRVSQPLLSWHLGVLKRINLVRVRRDGRLVWYSFDREVLDAYRGRLAAWIGGRDLAEDKGEEKRDAEKGE